jgi:hypothetical protein
MSVSVLPALIFLTSLFAMSFAAFVLYASVITWYKEKYRSDWVDSRFEFYRGCGAILVFWGVAVGALFFAAYYVHP